MVIPLFVGREKSIKALESAMSQKTEIFLVTQKDANEDEPQPGSLHTVGTIAVVMQLLRLPDGTIKALVEGKRRGKIASFQPQPTFMAAEIDEILAKGAAKAREFSVPFLDKIRKTIGIQSLG